MAFAWWLIKDIFIYLFIYLFTYLITYWLCLSVNGPHATLLSKPHVCWLTGRNARNKWEARAPDKVLQNG